jgi:hypothetical protein
MQVGDRLFLHSGGLFCSSIRFGRVTTSKMNLHLRNKKVLIPCESPYWEKTVVASRLGRIYLPLCESFLKLLCVMCLFSICPAFSYVHAKFQIYITFALANMYFLSHLFVHAILPNCPLHLPEEVILLLNS